MRNYDLEVKISKNNDSIVKNNKKCISCGYCKRVCKDEVTALKIEELSSNKEPICINCGQCINVCPTESLHEKFDYIKIKKILKNKKGKTIVFSIAPAVRTSINEEFGLETISNPEKKIVTALKNIGADYVFDVTFGADLTVMEEAMELVNRLKENKNLPMFTSCCPAWVKYAEIFYPKLLPNLSTTKSPIAIMGTIIKTYFSKKINVDSKDIINIVIAPCTAKKNEINREELSISKKDTDYVLTTKELSMLLKEYNIDITSLKDSNFSSPLGNGSSAGVIFGTSGGVMESSLRTAYYFLTGKNLNKEDIVFSEVRGNYDIKENSIKINNREIKVCVLNGMNSANKVIDKIMKNEVYYDFIEVMNCKGGCISGGGQPKVTILNTTKTRNKRMNALYEKDEKSILRLCHENKEIKSLYDNFLGNPNSEISLKLLHRTYFDKSYLLEGEKNE